MGDERTTDARLHAYFDGELSPAEAAEVRQQLEADPGLRAKLDGLGEVRAVVRASVAPELGDLPSDDLWARIEARIAEEAPRSASSTEKRQSSSAAEGPQRPGLRVIQGGPSRAKDAASEADAAPRAPDEHPAASAPDTLDAHRRRRVVGVVIAGLALAAAVLLVVLRPGEPPPGTSPELVATGEGDREPALVRDPEPESAEELVFRTEVLEVDFGDNSGAVFSVEGDDGERYAVVWLADVQPKRTATEQ